MSQKKQTILAQGQSYLDVTHPLHILSQTQDPWQVSVAVILSGHCTDAAVNKVVPGLFEKFPTASKFLQVNPSKDEVIKLLPGISHSGNKTDYLFEVAKYLTSHEGQFPRTLAEITKIKGVGRKTGGIILYRCYGIDEGFPLDTHCLRVLERLGWYSSTSPKSLEKALLRDIPEGWRNKAHIILTQLGRLVCTPSKPKCEECFLVDHCQFFRDITKKAA
jgi:endonuclease-3